MTQSSRQSILHSLRQQQNCQHVQTVVSPRAASLQDADLRQHFIKRALAMQTTVAEVIERNALPLAVADYLVQHGLPPQLVCWPEFADLDWQASGITMAARPASAEDLIGLTGCFAAIAETGSLMLCSSSTTPALNSLLPETHLAILDVRRIVARMEDAFALLRTELQQPPRAVNFVSGPSRTGDIEQTITLGAHGPYRVHVLLLNDQSCK